MAILFMDSFDHVANQTTQVGEKWGSWTGNASAFRIVGGRNGNGLIIDALTPSLQWSNGNSYSTLMVQFATSLSTYRDDQRCFEFLDSGTTQVGLRIGGGGQLYLVRSWSTWLANFAVLSLSTWYYIELKIVFGNSGSWVCKVNGITYTGSGDTTQTANNYANQVALFNMGGNGYASQTFDDFMVLDTSGSAPYNDLCGDHKIEALRPTGSGSNTAWTPNTGTDWDAINDTTPDDDSTYISKNNASLPGKMTGVMGNLATTAGTIGAVQTVLRARKDITGETTTINPVLRPTSTDYTGDNIILGQSYSYYKQMYTTNPDDSQAWEIADVNGIEAGVSRTT